MRAEYLLFDLLILAGPLTLSLMPRHDFLSRAKSLAIATLVVALPFIAWDAAVAGSHWWFDARYTVGVELFGLPIEEVLFFIAVPYACAFSWETLLGGANARATLPSTPSEARATRGTPSSARSGGRTTPSSCTTEAAR